MTHLVDVNGQPLNPTAALALIDEETLDALYDCFDADAPMGWSIEHVEDTANQERITVQGWRLEKTEEGYPWHELHEASVTVEIPETYKNVLEDTASPRMTNEERPEVDTILFAKR